MIKLLGILLALAIITAPMQASAQNDPSQTPQTSQSASETPNGQEPDADVQEKQDSEEEAPVPIPTPKKSSIMSEINIGKQIGELRSSQIVFKNSSDCFMNSSFVFDIPEDGTPASQTPLASDSSACFLRIDISKKPASAMGSADEKVSNAEKFISSLPGLSKRVKGILLMSRADSEASPWNGSEEELYAYSTMIARGLKKYDSRILIGGPGFERTFEGSGKYEAVSQKLKDFMDYAERVSAPFDIIYITSPNLMPYSYFLEPAFLKSKILPEYKKTWRKGVYFAIGEGIPDERDALEARTYAVQNMICAAKAEADFIELPSCIEGLCAEYAVKSLFKDESISLFDTQGLDRLSFLIQACSPDKDSIYMLIGASNPSKTISEMEACPLKSKMEEEYRNIVHKFTYGIYSPEYSRFRISLTGCKWQGKTVSLKRYTMKRGGFIELEEESSFNGRSEFYFNKSISTPSAVLIKLEASDRQPEAEQTEE